MLGLRVQFEAWVAANPQIAAPDSRVSLSNSGQKDGSNRGFSSSAACKFLHTGPHSSQAATAHPGEVRAKELDAGLRLFLSLRAALVIQTHRSFQFLLSFFLPAHPQQKLTLYVVNVGARRIDLLGGVNRPQSCSYFPVRR